jgi:predicted dinucleotide-binding enzyme
MSNTKNLKIGIIGAGNMGKHLARKLAQAGHDVKVANSRGPETIDADVLEFGARAVTKAEAVEGVEVVILSTPFDCIPDFAPLLAGAPEETVVIDTSNYYPSNGRIDDLDAGQVDSLWVVKQLGRPIAKAWNSIFTISLETLGTTKGDPNRIAIPVSADRETDREVALALVEDTGFDAFFAGSLAESWRQQPGAPVYCTDPTLTEIPEAIDSANRERVPKRRDLVVAVLAERFGDTSEQNSDPTYFRRLSRVICW